MVAGTSSAHFPQQQAGSMCEAGGQARTLSDWKFSPMGTGRDVHRQHLLLPLGFRSMFRISLASRAFRDTHRPEIIVFLFTFEKQFVVRL